MSGNVQGIGFQLDKVSYCNKARGGCGQEIRWGQMFGKRHPFNLDGTSHFDTCPNADEFRKGYGPSLRTLGDRDTFYRQRWRETYLGVWDDFDLSLWSPCDLRRADALRIGRVLSAVGGPLHYSDWTPGIIANHCYGAVCDDAKQVCAVSIDKSILWRIRDYLRESEVRVYYCVAGVCLVHGTAREV